MNAQDLRGMVPPQPMEIILDCAEAMQPGESVSFILPHYPGPLIPHLKALDLAFSSEMREDGSVVLRLERR
jgi:uncharacterized protein (DUF2249 family)